MGTIEALEYQGLLSNIRKRLGAEDEEDTSRDYKIEKMDARSLVAVYFGWELGDDNWGYNIIDEYISLKEELDTVSK